MTARAVLFDCDGVIVDSERIGLALLRENLAGHGLALAPAEIHRLFVGGTIYGAAEAARAMGADLPAGWVEAHYEALYARLAEGVALIDGIEQVFDRLDAAGILYAVGSNGTLRKMRITLSQHPGIWARVRGRLYSGQEIGAPKPAPDLYLHAAAGLGVAPGEAVVVDDSASGCRAGIAAGMRTLGFAPDAADGARLAALGAEPFAAMDALPGLIGL